jgi:hypothetical protein
MPNILVETAHASYTVGSDPISGQIQARVPYDRWLIGVGIVGSASTGDCEATVLIGQEEIGPFRNSALGLGITQDNLIQVREFVPANMIVAMRVNDAAASNNVLTALNFVRAGA